jgi:hypothetical protein
MLMHYLLVRHLRERGGGDKESGQGKDADHGGKTKVRI